MLQEVLSEICTTACKPKKTEAQLLREELLSTGSSKNHNPPEVVGRLSLDVLQGTPRRVRQTPRPEWSMPLSHRMGGMSHRTPRTRRTPRNTVDATHAPPPSSRIGMASSTFAQCVMNGALNLEELPGEYEVGLGTVAKHVREHCHLGGNVAEGWDQPVVMHTEALSAALGIDWTEYQSNREEEVNAPTASSARRVSKEPAVRAPAKVGSAAPSRRQSKDVSGAKPALSTQPPSSVRGDSRQVSYAHDAKKMDISLRSEEGATTATQRAAVASSTAARAQPSQDLAIAHSGPSLFAAITAACLNSQCRDADDVDSQAVTEVLTLNAAGAPAPAAARVASPAVRRTSGANAPRRLGPSASAPHIGKVAAQSAAPMAAALNTQWGDETFRATHIDYRALLSGRVAATTLRDLQNGNLHVVSPGGVRGGTVHAARGGAAPLRVEKQPVRRG